MPNKSTVQPIQVALDPLTEKEKDSIEISDDEIAKHWKFPSDKGGKWMFFVSRQDLNSYWQKAVDLYRSGKLDGVVKVKTSTNAYCPRAIDDEKNGCIRFRCGPADDGELMIRYGRNIAKCLNYYNYSGFVAYKTDFQTSKGTKATGQKINYFYRFSVPTSLDGKPRSLEIPSRTWNDSLLIHIKDSISLAYKQDWATLGSYRLRFPKKELDSAWVRACELYNDELLEGVIYIRSTTAKAQPGFENSPVGVISFYCGPFSDVKLMKAAGKNIAQYMNYRPRNNLMKFNVYIPGVKIDLYTVQI